MSDTSNNAMMPVLPSNQPTVINSATSGNGTQTWTPRSRSTSPVSDLMPRRLFDTDDAEGNAELDESLGIENLPKHGMHQPGPKGSCLSHAQLGKHLQNASDEEFAQLMQELRATAQRVLMEDDWMFRSSDDILGFSDA
ncbi:uncharacterized protein LOC129593328 [Paramacrobiotus metropolitanus]|uniref:uncharacterized protein LOC129593328 n=1 Tax=Paramacrobiotus metropolitanus TaxID=2943436 RepID=UPI0024461FDA|nr:uncharacterized protein LOC129593328 [Paramacrobiotus metropolitanus]